MGTIDEMPINWARDAMAALVTDEPLAQRLHEALKCLSRLRSLHEYDPVVIEMLNSAQDSTLRIEQKAERVAELIVTVLRVRYP
ncbi:MAG TPA: hypothetical protein VFA51_14695 [Candidatus Udaeobacter sp.]|nr:hypothetical protein [Candidatus Udaeobacter sp.]